MFAKTFAISLLLALTVCLASAEQAQTQLPSDDDMVQPVAFLEFPDMANIGYVPTSVPFDNPATLADLVPSIPVNKDCTVRPQTIVEIKRMRRSAARIAQMIQTEVLIMEKRKTYIEQMTAYLNDRIRELNKVKSDLAQELKWIEISNQRINELANREKLIKMQDILSCLKSDQQRLQGAKDSQTNQIQSLQKQTSEVENNINIIKNTIELTALDKPTHVLGAVPGAPGTPGAPAAPPATPPA